MDQQTDSQAWTETLKITDLFQLTVYDAEYLAVKLVELRRRGRNSTVRQHYFWGEKARARISTGRGGPCSPGWLSSPSFNLKFADLRRTQAAERSGLGKSSKNGFR
jgi:hypothetical protein